MSVEQYQATAPVIHLSDKAKQHIRKQLAKQQAVGLRLIIKQSGCSGYRYELAFANSQEPNDIVLDIDADIRFFIQPKDQALVNNTTIDFVTEGLNSSFKFNNAHASGSCGCGESFTIS